MTLRNFVLLVDTPTVQQQNAITGWLRREGFGFWHNCASGWLIATRREQFSAAALRDQVRLLMGGAQNTLVALDVTGSDLNHWAGYGDPNIFKWMRASWEGSDKPP